MSSVETQQDNVAAESGSETITAEAQADTITVESTNLSTGDTTAETQTDTVAVEIGIELDTASAEVQADELSVEIGDLTGSTSFSVTGASISTSIADFTTLGDKFFLTQRRSVLPVTRIDVVIQGTGGGLSVTWELRKGPDLSAAGTVVDTDTTTNTTTGDSITTIAAPSVSLGDHLWFEFTGTSGTPEAFNAVVTFE